MTGFPTMGGSGLIATRLGIELASRGHDIHFLFYKKPFFLKDYDTLDNITFHMVDQPSYALFKDIGAPYTIQASSKISEIAKQHKIDIMHSHYAIPHAVVSYLAKKMVDIKTIVTTHGSDTHSLGKDPSYNSTISLALKDTDIVTSVSNFLARETEIVFGLDPQSIEVIYDFVNPSEFIPTAVEREKTIIHASNFRPIKQVPYMIEIFAELITDFPDWKLKLVGTGPDWPICQRETRRLKIKEQVQFLGVRRDIPELMSKAAILGSTSQVESFGITIAEAMACETPVWASAVGGVPEVCEDQVTGLLFDPNSKDDAIDKLARLMTDEELRSRLGRNGRERVQQRFSTTNIVSRYEQIYDRVLYSDREERPPILN